MTDQGDPNRAQPPPGSIPSPDDGPPEGRGLATARMVDPQKLLRIAGVTREVLDEARRIRPDAGAVDHLRRVHERIREELQEALPPELYEELKDLSPGVRDGTLEELALAHAEILGWLEGLFQGTQLAIQLHAAQALAEQGTRPGLPRRPSPPEDEVDSKDSRYL